MGHLLEYLPGILAGEALLPAGYDYGRRALGEENYFDLARQIRLEVLAYGLAVAIRYYCHNFLLAAFKATAAELILWLASSVGQPQIDNLTTVC
jgi:hypothetical protein